MPEELRLSSPSQCTGTWNWHISASCSFIFRVWNFHEQQLSRVLSFYHPSQDIFPNSYHLSSQFFLTSPTNISHSHQFRNPRRGQVTPQKRIKSVENYQRNKFSVCWGTPWKHNNRSDNCWLDLTWTLFHHQCLDLQGKSQTVRNIQKQALQGNRRVSIPLKFPMGWKGPQAENRIWCNIFHYVRTALRLNSVL